MSKFIKNMTFLLGLLIFNGINASPKEISLNEFLEACKTHYSDSSTYYQVETNDSVSWTIFIDPAPSAMWGHDCYIAKTCKNTTDDSTPPLWPNQFSTTALCRFRDISDSRLSALQRRENTGM